LVVFLPEVIQFLVHW